MSSEIKKATLLFSAHLERELRFDYAGQTGAVFMYKGITAVAKLRKDPEFICFAKHHGATKAGHLQLIESV